MSMQPVKFYQSGTFTVGNRLLPDAERTVQANMRRTNSLNSGHRACQGCGEALGARYAIDAAMQATGAKAMADMGKVMAALKPKLAGRADMAKVSAQIKAKLG